MPYLRLSDYFTPRMMHALRYLDAHISLFDELGKYFTDPTLRLAFTFQVKYLGVDLRYDHLPHHTIFFANDYRRNVDEIAEKFVISEDPSFYVQNASVTDPTLAPHGHSTLYVLVPIANNRSGISWASEQARYRDLVLDRLENRAGLTNLRRHIKVERMITPHDWEHQAGVYDGATFNLGHSVDQMLYFRPHNRFDDIEDCYLVVGGTHPGSGLPTIHESGRIAANLIIEEFNR